MLSSGIRPVDSFRYMAYEVGGEDMLGHTKKDHLNYVNRLKMKAIEAGDAQTLIDTLQQQCVEDNEFFFRVKLDDDGKLCNIFWRDSMMKEDYEINGDVVIFDTTYRTNKYNLICAPFVRINNHWKNITFGCAFIANEKIESFEWLFDVFKKSMGGKSPITVFTDQDQAISNAIESVFPTTRHRLCIWHLYQNAISRFERLKSNKLFNDAFHKCLTGCANVDEFENCWRSLISTYDLGDNSWFKRLYDLRLKWCTAYNKDFFSAGVLSLQRSESTNSTIGFNAKKTTSLNDFYIIFQNTVKQWRSNEAKDEFDCSRVVPTSCIPLTGFFKHASEVYTLTTFKYFEEEFLKSIATLIKLLCEELDVRVYQVTDVDGMTSHNVSFYMVNFFVSCSCKKFDETGLLCCHCLRIMNVHSVPYIPDCYVKRRWTKFVKHELWDKYSRSNNHSVQFESSTSSASWRHQIIRKYYNLAIKAQQNEGARKIVEDGWNGINTALEEYMSTVELNSRTVDEDMEISVSSSHVVLDPSRSITKGRKARIKSFSKNKRMRIADATTSTSNQSKEFGTKTPNPRLF